MVIDLTRNERRAFFRFLSLYLSSSFVLLFLIATLFYRSEYRLYFDLAKSNMQNEAFKLSAKIINTHMQGFSFDKRDFPLNSSYKVGFYGESGERIYGDITQNIDFSKQINEDDNSITLVDKSTFGHLGVYYVVLQEHNFENKIDKLIKKIVLVLAIFYAFVVIVAFFLAKMFIKPIQNERLKLNNFIKDTTHELNTPITAILMSSENENLSKKAVERINISARRLSEIYKDLTYLFLKDESKKSSESLALHEVLNEQLIYFEALASKKRVEINKDIKESFYKIDKESFTRLSSNLISNAIKYNRVGGSIKIGLDKDSFFVEDSGVGIKKRDLEDIFKRFYRANEYEGGFGIGLNIVSEICKEYDLKVEVASTEGLGSCFRVWFKREVE